MTLLKLVTLSLYIAFINSYADTPFVDQENADQLVEAVSSLSDDGGELRAQFDKEKEKEREKTDCPKGDDLVKKPIQKRVGKQSTQSSDAVSPSPGIQVFFDFKMATTAENGNRQINSTLVNSHMLAFWVRYEANYLGISRYDLLAKTDTELKRYLKMHTGISGLSPAETEMMAENGLTVLRMSQLGSAEESFNFAAERLKGASKEQKINFLATYLRALHLNYEDSMVKGYKPILGVPSALGEQRFDDDLHQALGLSVIHGTPVLKGGGVCRHIHAAGVRLAKKIGFDEVFGLGFRTPGNGHMTMVMTDPSNPLEVVHFNYGTISINKGVSGPSALGQNGTIPDTGIKYSITDSRNNFVLELPSDIGGILHRVTGGKIRDLGSRIQDQAQIRQAGIKTPFGSVRGFHATTPLGNGEEAIGVAHDKRFNLGKSAFVEYGLSGFNTQRRVAFADLSSSGVFGRASIGFDHELISSSKLKLRTFGKVNTNGMLFKSDLDYGLRVGGSGLSENDSRLNQDGYFLFNMGISGDYQLGSVSNRTSLRADGHVSDDDISNTNGLEAHISTYSIDHDSKVPITSNTDLSIGGGVTAYDLGSGVYGTYHSRLGVDARSLGTNFSMSASGRLTSDTPLWLPQAEHTGQFSLSKRLFGKRYHLGLEGQKSFEISGNHYLGLSFGGTLGGR